MILIIGQWIIIIACQDMSGEAETSSEPTLAPAPPLAASFADVSPASVLKLTRITEDYLCPPQVRFMWTVELHCTVEQAS